MCAIDVSRQASAQKMMVAALLGGLLLTGCGGGGTDEGGSSSMQTTITNPFTDPSTTTVFLSNTSVYQNQLAVDFTYDVTANPDVVGFKVYDAQGATVCTKNNIAELQTQVAMEYHLECYYNASSQNTTFTMTAIDGNGGESAPTASFVANIAPVAVLQASVTGGTVNFNAGTSYDRDNDSIVSYAWNLGDGSQSSGASFSHVYQPGVYTVNLQVVDGDGASATTQVTVTII